MSENVSIATSDASDGKGSEQPVSTDVSSYILLRTVPASGSASS